MLTEPNIDKNIIYSKIEENYGIDITNLSFVPGGEASWGYKVNTKGGKSYFFKIHTGLTEHEKRFELTYQLYHDCGIQNITYPIKTSKNELVIYLDKYLSALFPFISGNTAAQKPLDAKQRFTFGALLGKIHNTKDSIDFLLKEDFTYRNTNRIIAAVKNASVFSADPSLFKRKTANLLTQNEDKIKKCLQVLQILGDKLRNQNLNFVICHGEPHKWNTMISDEGEVFLIDWDDCLLAPKEKDLNVIKEDSLKLDGYKSIVGDFDINNEIIHYYNLEWNISEIDAWSNSLFYGKANDIQNQHYLEELISDLEELNSK